MSNAAATSMDPSGGGGPNNEHGHAGDQFRFEDRMFRFLAIIQTRQNELRRDWMFRLNCLKKDVFSSFLLSISISMSGNIVLPIFPY